MVLRPGGALLGYDVVGDGVGRIVNGREHGTRRMRIEELRQQLRGLPFSHAVVNRSLGGKVARFAASRSPDRAAEIANL